MMRFVLSLMLAASVTADIVKGPGGIKVDTAILDDKAISEDEFLGIMGQLLDKAKEMGKLDGGKGPDMNKDGLIDLEDAKMIFGFIDANHDGSIKQEEVLKLKQMFLDARKVQAEAPTQSKESLGPYILGASIVLAAAIVYSKPRPSASDLRASRNICLSFMTSA